MQRICFGLTILALASLMVGCASNSGAQPVAVKALDNPTATEVAAPAPVVSPIPEKPTATEVPATSEVVSSNPPADCPVTTTEILSFEAPEPYSPTAPWPNMFWFGSEPLWTALDTNGIWSGLPHNPDGYTQKIVWWSDGYIWDEDPEPKLIVTGERQDAKAPALQVSKANGVYANDMGSAMMVGVDFPTLGCWKITGKYKDTELSFVVWVAP